MSSYQHISSRHTCPFLPNVDIVIRPSQLRESKEGNDREAYFLATLRCAHSLWLCGFLAQALLQLNFSLSLDLPENSPAEKEWQRSSFALRDPQKLCY